MNEEESSQHDKEPPPKKAHGVPLARLKTGSFERNLSLTKLGLGAGTSIAIHAMANIFRGEVNRSQADRDFFQAQAQVLADELGQLKGSVMKAGQMLSLYGQYFLPEEAVAVLSGLQDDTAPVAWPVILPVLQAELGSKLSELDIDTQPLAAASLGQAHRARRKSDGLELVVKVQYPGVAGAIESDIKTLTRLLAVTRLAPKDLDLTGVFAEVREMLLREVDYRREANNTRQFAAMFAHDDRYGFPEVLADYSTGKILTTTYQRGVSVRDESVQNLSQDRKNKLAQAFFDLFLVEFFKNHAIQSDPHFGNYRIVLDKNPKDSKNPQDKIICLDFGAVREFDQSFVQAYSKIVEGAMQSSPEEIKQGAIDIGLIKSSFPPAALQAFVQMCERIVEPFVIERAPAALQRGGAYGFGESDLPMRVSTLAAKNALSVHFKMPPPEIVFLHRRLGGVFVTLSTLKAELALGQDLAAALVLSLKQR